MQTLLIIIVLILVLVQLFTFFYIKMLNEDLRHLKYLVQSDIWTATQKRMGTSIHDSKHKGR